jgi:hypothetical protein
MATKQGIMGRQAEFNAISNEVALRYTSFLETILSAYNRTILSADITARSIDTFKKEVANIHKHYLEREIKELVSAYEKLKTMIDLDTQQVAVSVTADDEWATYLSENTNFLYDAIKLQSSKDVLYVNNFLRAKVLQVMSMNDYQVAYNLVFNHRDLSFYYTDKLGRKINSVKYMRTAARDYLVKNYNDLVAGSAILNGIEEVVIENVDKNHEHNGKVIAVTGNDGVNYFDIREDIFHPNSNSIVRLT